MKFKNLNKNKLLIILLSSFVVTTLSGCNNYNTPTTPTYNNRESETNTNEKNNEEKIQENNEIEYSENDILVINEFETLEQQTENLIESGDNILEKAKGIFITTVDFIFFDSEINGVKFDDLTESGKQKVLEITTNIDTKIESKFPNYKDEISKTTKEALNKASELISIGAENINEFAKEKLGEKYYNELIEAKDELFEYSKKAIDILGDFSKDLYDTGKEKIKNWYDELKK